MTYLKSTNRITIKTNSQFTLVEIKKWEEYQLDNQQSNQPVTNQQPTSNHKQEGKNDKNTLSKDKEKPVSAPRTAKKDIILLSGEPMEQTSNIDRSFPRNRTWGDESINWLLDYAEHLMAGRKFSGQERWNRIYARHFKNKVGMTQGRRILEWLFSPDCWWHDKVNQFSTIYKNLDKIQLQMEKKDVVVEEKKANNSLREKFVAEYREKYGVDPL